MRDPARIDRILNAIRAKWKAGPDLRLGQLLINIAPRFENAGYHVEDDELEAALGPTMPVPGPVDCETCTQTLVEGGTTCIDCGAFLPISERRVPGDPPADGNDLSLCGGCGDPCVIWREDRPLYANDPCAWIREPGIWVFDCKNQDPREEAPKEPVRG